MSDAVTMVMGLQDIPLTTVSAHMECKESQDGSSEIRSPPLASHNAWATGHLRERGLPKMHGESMRSFRKGAEIKTHRKTYGERQRRGLH